MYTISVERHENLEKKKKAEVISALCQKRKFLLGLCYARVKKKLLLSQDNAKRSSCFLQAIHQHVSQLLAERKRVNVGAWIIP
jgi:hypothetical protein